MSVINRVASLASDTGVAEKQLSTKESEDLSVAQTSLKTQQAPAEQVKNGALLVEVYPMLHAVNGATANAAPFIITDDGSQLGRIATRSFRALRAFLSKLVNNRPFQDISLRREVSYVMTANGPLLYRWPPNNLRQPENHEAPGPQGKEADLH